MASRFFYQPTGNPELDAYNTVVRKSYDRFESMLSFSEEYFGDSLSQKTFFDIGCSYGYFVNNFKKYCSESAGIDNEKKSIVISKLFYPDIRGNVHIQDFLQAGFDLKKHNIVSFLSVFQHFIIEEYEEEYLIEIIKIIDEATEDILFFEMGEEHESWYKEKLSGWNADSIPEWIIKNTTFDFCVPLMKDQDSVGEFSENYGRTLFVCSRK
jgi:hypothetical protein